MSITSPLTQMRADMEAGALQERASALLGRLAESSSGAGLKLRETRQLLQELVTRLVEALGEVGGGRELVEASKALVKEKCKLVVRRLVSLFPQVARAVESRLLIAMVSLSVGFVAAQLMVRRAPRLKELGMLSVVCGSYSGPEALALCRIPVPRILHENEVLVKVMANGLDRSDLLAVSGWCKVERRRQHGGFTIGRDFCGVVVEAGVGVKHLVPGDRVWGATPAHLPGVLAEQVVVPASLAHKMPTNLNWEGAATVPYSALQVWAALVWRGGMVPEQGAGTSVLVVDGVTDTGCLAVQLTSLWGASVTALCSARTAPLARALGAHAVVAADGEDCEAALREFAPFHLVLEAGELLPRSTICSLLASRGRITSALPPPLSSDHWGAFRRLFHPTWRCLFSAPCAHPTSRLIEPLAYVTTAVQAGKLQPVLDSVVSPREVADTLARFAVDGAVGKSVVLWDKL